MTLNDIERAHVIDKVINARASLHVYVAKWKMDSLRTPYLRLNFEFNFALSPP